MNKGTFAHILFQIESLEFIMCLFWGDDLVDKSRMKRHTGQFSVHSNSGLCQVESTRNTPKFHIS